MPMQNLSTIVFDANLKVSRFGDLPPVFVLATHFDAADLHNFEDELTDAGVTLTYDIHEAALILSKASKPRRIQFDLRTKGLWTEEIKESSATATQKLDSARPLKRIKLEFKSESQIESQGQSSTHAIVLDDDETASEGEDAKRSQPSDQACAEAQPDIVTVLKAEWFSKSRSVGEPLPIGNFVTFRGRKITKSTGESRGSITTTTKSGPPGPVSPKLEPHAGDQILQRAKQEAGKSNSDNFGQRTFGHQQTSPSKNKTWTAIGKKQDRGSRLLQQTTTGDDDSSSSEMPGMPEWVRAGTKYACQRPTPKTSPNDPFIKLLKEIKLARVLTNDEIGVRAYSTSIASLAAYPHEITTPREIIALPGCDTKIANLFVEWMNTGAIKAVDDIEADPDLKILRLFYNIWGVGATTARDFYFERGWKELDDIVEYGWSVLTRVQQIGVKYYDEFLDPIPRAEVETIGQIIHRHAIKVRDDQIQSLLVGGFRRGKEACGDVDIIVSHPDEEQTANLVSDIVTSLEEEGWITHTLTLSLHNSHRGQQTLPFNTGSGGHGFDTLDKALVVWQDPTWSTQVADLAADLNAKNPNIHRRVDIIISPWRTVGCAVVGWSGGTTFERDLRRYAKNSLGWKFDSSGIRSRSNGEVVDIEGFYDTTRQRAETMVEAEKRVFEGLQLEYRDPEERCTG